MKSSKKSILSGIGFGFTSGVITTLGLILGLSVGTQSKLAVIGGILTIAIADAMSDSLGIQIAQESAGNTKEKNTWIAAAATFLSKLVSALTFAVPFMLFSINVATVICLIWGFIMLSIVSFSLANELHQKPLHIIKSHLGLSLLVLLASLAVGELIKKYLG